MLALEVAQIMEFCHHDLYDRNVIMRPVPPTIVSYPLKSRVVRLQLDSIATLTDYDVAYARITLDNQTITVGSSTDLTSYGIYSTKPQPLYDAFKLLGFLAYGANRYQRQEFWPMTKYCLAFFTKLEEFNSDVELIGWLARLRSYYFSLGPATETATLSDYLTYLSANSEVWLVES